MRYLFERTTGDDPFHPDPSATGVGDAETTIRRQFEVPATRTFSATTWVSASADSSDAALDRLAGYRGPVRATSSSRFGATPGVRASAALDGDPATAWIGDYRPGRPAWIAWHTRRASVIDALRLLAPRAPVRRASVIRLSWPGGSSAPLAVAPDGTVSLPRPIRTASLRIDVLQARFASQASAADARAVGIAEIVGGPRVRLPRIARLDTGCGAVRLRVGTVLARLRMIGSRAAFDAGTPLQAVACGSPVTLAAGRHELESLPGPLAVDELELISRAPRPKPATPLSAGRVLDPGSTGRASVSHVRVAVQADAWLVLGEGYNRGWQASCDGHSLGPPRPIDGYASGWPVRPGCRDVNFAFTPNRSALVAYAISALAGAACVLLLCLAALRRRRNGWAPLIVAPEPMWIGDAAPAGSWRLVRALAIAIPVGAGFGFVYGVAAGLLAIPVLAVILWRGVGAGALTVIAGVLLGVVVPVLYLVHPGGGAGGNHYGYATQHMAAHWVAVAAIGLLDVALARVLAGQWRQRATGTAVTAPPAADASAPAAGSPASSS